MKRKRRSVASYRAASLKAARTRRKMKEARKKIAEEFVEYLRPETIIGRIPDLRRRPTIDRIPKVDWRQ